MKSIPSLAISSFSLSEKKLEDIGLKLTPGGTHISRTIMLKEISNLFASTDSNYTRDDYRIAIINDNLLSKKTLATRKETFERLRSLYLLSAKFPSFKIFRYLADFDPVSLPLMAFLIAWSRDPLLRSSTAPVFRANVGSIVNKEDLKEEIIQQYQTRYSKVSIETIAKNTASSWTQSGHLVGRSKKTRKLVVASPAVLSLALYIGHLCGLVGEHLLKSPWVQLLDLSPNQARSQATELHRQRLVDFRAIGSVIDITFPKLDRIVGWSA